MDSRPAPGKDNHLLHPGRASAARPAFGPPRAPCVKEPRLDHLRRAPALALLAGLALSAASCRPAPAPETLRVAEVPLPSLGLYWIAKDQGFLAAEGIEVQAQRFATGRDGLAALLERRVDVALAYETPTAVRAFDAPGLRAITVLHTSTRSTRVVARLDRGIADGADLRGKRVGVPHGTNAEFFLDTLLALSGVRAGEIERVELAPEAVEGALARGEVDAVSIWYPYARSIPGTVELYTAAYMEMSVALTRADVLGERRGTLLRFLRALARAERFAGENPAEALAAVQRALGGSPHDGVVHEAWRRASPQLGMGHALLTLLEREAEWHRARSGKPAPRIRPLLAPELLEEVVPDAVTLLPVE